MSERVYLDHNATTPIDPAVLAAMDPYLRTFYGNPSSVEHEDGHLAAAAVELAREQTAECIGARPNEIVFTGSCTEADNLAIIGVAKAYPDKKHIITTSIEHPAVIESARALETEGWRVTYLPVDEYGMIDPSELERSITDETSLVSIMAANNEVGTLQPLETIGAICLQRGVLFHSDLAQTIAYVPVDVEKVGIHLASLSAHKTYGPKGVGALYVRSRKPRARIKPIILGGGQERSLRPGTLNTAGIVGMGEAFARASRLATKDAARLSQMCVEFRTKLLAEIPAAKLNGDPDRRLANNLSFSIEGIEPLALMRRLRDRISFSASSACATDKVTTSHVLKAMFGDGLRAKGAFRLAPGRFTTKHQFEAALGHLIAEIRLLKDISRPAA
ncbi:MULTISPECIES: cysteine desulfurase family protein [unclassified Bradyrhizobium]|uniref:cysteine desulfurase family protein n=1 Tax=unclassified Bradyrhizobium TaxID=2631580 RepID=UPI001FFBC2D4|nr:MULTISPECIES: cysteine desulfurase family protein [unclassified Bradyrhizobium]MCK1397020.1 cysteine desulfurase [Bradyrhizobium sp. 39]MCK1630249.1 cysteine desulfurase [Bradyrhizobium sp. 162]MCK1691019.1 cysteine desulfurase [Bradyrhizobium sp. 145]MCK1751378.1 cysteine desulfurase [Bradyrhizobium sp. 135]UPJ36273.1 cysteine desulfurase [Bradyrhizobium sp. 4]